MTDVKTEAATRLALKETVPGEYLEVGIGEYRRRFERADEPFVITDREEAERLLRTGHFIDLTRVAAEEAEAREQAKAEDARKAEESKGGREEPPRRSGGGQQTPPQQQ